MSAAGGHTRRAVALGACLLVGLFLLWGGRRLWGFGSGPERPGPESVRANEQLAFERLRAIIAAQERYRATDWDRDGRKTYAAFLAHLWTALDPEDEPLRVNLIPRRLAFAMEAPRALDGYFYVDLRWKQTGRHRKRLLDWKREWAVAALPQRHAETGRLVMLVDQSGEIFVKDYNTRRFFLYPSHPAQFGWRRLQSAEELVKLQQQRAADG